jgi:hypothetical protein
VHPWFAPPLGLGLIIVSASQSCGQQPLPAPQDELRPKMLIE